MSELAYGLDADLKRKKDAKYCTDLEAQVCGWIGAVTGEAKGSQSVQEWLMSGRVLCKLANTIKPGIIKNVNTMNAPFKHMENITYFMNAARDCGVPEASLFGTPDLYEDRSMITVITSLYFYAGVIQISCPGFAGPHLGSPVAVDNAGKDQKRDVLKATQTGGLKGAMEHTGSKPHAGGRERGQKDGKEHPAMKPREDGMYGMDADLKAKQDAKYDSDLERQVVAWIQAITGESQGDQSVQEWLKSGAVLCKLANCIRPGTIKKINTMNAPFKQMENITFFMNAARDLGVAEASMFGTPDLYEDKNMGGVISGLYAFGGAVQGSCPGFSGPRLGTIAAQTRSGDKKRQGGPATQSGGYSTSLEVQDPHQSAKGIVKPGFHGVPGTKTGSGGVCGSGADAN